MSEPRIDKAAGGSSPADDPIRRTEIIVSNVLRGGVILSALVLLAGVLLFFALGDEKAYASISGGPSYPHGIAEVFAGLGRLDPVSIMALGLMLMIITPVTRVAVSIYAFAKEGDWRYVLVTGIVLLVLIGSFLLGKAGT